MQQEYEIEYNGVTLVVKGDYTPEEKEVMYYSDMSGHPGSPAEFCAQEIYASDSNVNIIDLLSEEVVEEIELKCLENVGD
jgi:hypothetical protein